MAVTNSDLNDALATHVSLTIAKINAATNIIVASPNLGKEHEKMVATAAAYLQLTWAPPSLNKK